MLNLTWTFRFQVRFQVRPLTDSCAEERNLETYSFRTLFLFSVHPSPVLVFRNIYNSKLERDSIKLSKVFESSHPDVLRGFLGTNIADSICAEERTRSRIICSPSLTNFRDPGSSIFSAEKIWLRPSSPSRPDVLRGFLGINFADSICAEERTRTSMGYPACS